MNKVLVITGPTASGKTAVAIEKAKTLNGEIINYDSLQVYKDIPTLTAYPTVNEINSAPHKLFGYLNYNDNISVVDWAKSATTAIQKTWSRSKLPILVGGTGMYIDILIHGISPLPDISQEVRNQAIELSNNNYEQLCNDVYNFDLKIKNIIKPENHHQMIRAWEIQTESNKSIIYFYSLPKQMFINAEFEFININIDREFLYNKINKRFDIMLENGAINEVEELMKKFNDNNYEDLFKKYHIFKAIGAKEIVRYLNNKISYNTMVELSKQYSRNYAKRQITWFKYHCK
ncbi:MAG: tRNA (adenosine(37)-N6)-dimethylallyltransferase MiaA [Alphaproteobacteria bacterium]|nr:tRNA (adenosine(37)-N6)-dimethylallyltransferase MiaA [Alphaproteobacteria bacterium]